MSEFASTGHGFLGETSAAKESQVIPIFYRAQKYQPPISGTREMATSVPIDMVEIRQVGEADNQKEEVNELHKRRWPTQWAAYQAGREQTQVGTPVENLYPGLPEIAVELKRFNIHTIEGLANTPDSAADRVPFLTERKKIAQAYLERNQKASGFDELEAKNKELADRLASLEQLLEKKTAPKATPKLETQEA